MLFSVRMDGNEVLNFAIFRPLGRKFKRIYIYAIFRPYGRKLSIIMRYFRVSLKSDGRTGQTTGHLAALGSASRYMARRKATRQATELTTV